MESTDRSPVSVEVSNQGESLPKTIPNKVLSCPTAGTVVAVEDFAAAVEGGDGS